MRPKLYPDFSLPDTTLHLGEFASSPLSTSADRKVCEETIENIINGQESTRSRVCKVLDAMIESLESQCA